jgi:hypothetical protein
MEQGLLVLTAVLVAGARVVAVDLTSGCIVSQPLRRWVLMLVFWTGRMTAHLLAVFLDLDC